MSLRDQWEASCKNFLVGKTVKQVRYMTDKELDTLDWHAGALVIEFTDGSWMFPSADDEGNGAGALFTSEDDLEIIPVMHQREA
tara:strand:+ start:336 stop:587 length:252 start_codon:yes stop_codon:yes gene_type:complete